MKTSVRLQEPFSYSLLPIIILGIIIVGLLIWFVIYFIRKGINPKEHRLLVPQRTPIQMENIRQKYLNELNKIQADFVNQRISLRTFYQKMSKTIRSFVHAVTGIRVNYFTLQEIKSLNMPSLEELIAECYVPEFSKQSSGDIMVSLEKAKRIIQQWN